MRKNAIIAGAIIVGLFGTGLAFLLIINQSRYQNAHQKSMTQARDQSRHQDAQEFVAQAGTDAALDKPRKLLDLSTPEDTLGSYINCLRLGDLDGVTTCYGGRGFYLSKLVPIKSYMITKRSEYSQDEINELITKDLMPEPPFEAGDVELEVKEIYSAGESEGPEPYKEGQEEMFTYTLRKVEDSWVLISHSAWDQN